MEKQRINGISRFIKRLLTLFLLFIFFNFRFFGAEVHSGPQESFNFKIKPNQSLFVNDDILFETTIPEASPNNVQILQTDDKKQDNVNFKSMKKFENYEEGGTKIQIFYSFEAEGLYKINPIKVYINGTENIMTFPDVKIKENPAKRMPRIVIIFSNGVKIKSDDILEDKPIFTTYVGQKLNFTVYLQYINQFVHLSFDIPKNSIYKQLKTYEIKELESKELIPVADFEWTGLIEGNQPIPKFKLTAIGYNGYKTELMLPEFQVNFILDKKNNFEVPEENLFEDAFSEPFIKNFENEKIEITDDDCAELAELYTKEKNAIFLGNKYKNKRIEFEEKLGLPESKNPFRFNLGILIICIFLEIIFAFLLIVAIRKKYVFKVFVLSILLFMSTLFLIFAIQKRSLDYGISMGCTVYSVPEEYAETSSEIAPGNLVRVTEKTGNWIHIQLGESGGWCNKENVIFIK